MRTDYPLFVLLAVTVVVGGTTAFSGRARPTEPLSENRRTYYNQEFGFSLEVPFFAPACDVADSNQDTGITFFLDEGASDCNIDWQDRRFISYHESYNAAVYASAEEMLRSLCDGTITATDARLFPEAVVQLPMMCKRTRDDAMYFELGGLTDDGGVMRIAIFQSVQPGISDVRYGEVFPRDLAIFRGLLANLRRFEPRS